MKFMYFSEHIVSILSSLLTNTTGSQSQRLVSKFTENDHEKVERMVELHFKYLQKLRGVDEKIEREKRVSDLCSEVTLNYVTWLVHVCCEHVIGWCSA